RHGTSGGDVGSASLRVRLGKPTLPKPSPPGEGLSPLSLKGPVLGVTIGRTLGRSEVVVDIPVGWPQERFGECRLPPPRPRLVAGAPLDHLLDPLGGDAG